MDSALVAIVPAAGQGTRAAGAGGLPKQYRSLGGQVMLRLAVRALLADARITQVRVAVAPGDARAAAVLAGLPRTLVRRCGGATRADTVRNALDDAGLPAGGWVLVHDAARPGLPAVALGRLIDTCWRCDRAGLLALPVTDTVKRARPAAVAASGGSAGAGAAAVEVAATLAREALWLAQTPQMFRAGELLAALRACAGNPAITDEASAMERAGDPARAPLLVPGARENLKLTWPEDFAWFERFLQDATT